MRKAVFWIAVGLMALVTGASVVRSAELRIELSSEPNALDPHFHALAPNSTISAHMFKTLTRVELMVMSVFLPRANKEEIAVATAMWISQSDEVSSP